MKNRIFFLLLFSFLSFSIIAETFENSSLEKDEVQEITEYFGDYDPWESFNRKVYHFNYGFDKYFFVPVVEGYQKITPDFIQHRISNFFDNTKNASSLGNALAQTKGRKALRSLGRLSINTILGLGGLFDVATALGMPKPYEDFGLTLAHYGVPRGPYLMLPLLGPSYLRDAFGIAVDRKLASNTAISLPTRYSLPLFAVDKKSRVSFRFYGTNSPFEYEYVRFLYKKYRTIQEETHQNFNIGGI
ncbi:MAG: VacJ family lipoprotein [Fusobacterium necrophorum]|nr:VacJ family lipoprotein [Fusobacterium necrophorum]